MSVPHSTQMSTGVPFNCWCIHKVDIPFWIFWKIFLQQIFQTVRGIPPAAHVAQHPEHTLIWYFWMRKDFCIRGKILYCYIKTAMESRSSSSMVGRISYFFFSSRLRTAGVTLGSISSTSEDRSQPIKWNEWYVINMRMEKRWI